jgi:hypothetical protein
MTTHHEQTNDRTTLRTRPKGWAPLPVSAGMGGGADSVLKAVVARVTVGSNPTPTAC